MKWIWHWGPASLMAGLIFWLSHQSDPPGAGIAPDYLGHFVVFFLLGSALVWGESQGWTRRLKPSQTIRAWLLTTGYGVFDEIHQSLVPGRDPSFSDGLTDCLAGLTAVLLLGWLSRRRPR